MEKVKSGKASFEEHLEYLEKIVHLKLFFLHFYLAGHPREAFRDVLRNRVDIYRKTALNRIRGLCPEVNFDDPEWRKMEDEAEAVYHRTEHDRTAFENETFQIFHSSILARAELDYETVWIPKESPCGSLIIETHLQPDGKSVAFHINNAVAPKSIFHDPSYIPQCLEKMLECAEKMNAQELICSSWLNSHPRWLACFPPEWNANGSVPEPDVQWHYGFWGQFISARKTFNDKYGMILREKENFPFPLRHCRCTIVSMKKFHSQLTIYHAH